MQSKTNLSLPINKIIKICQFELPVNGALGVNVSQLYI